MFISIVVGLVEPDRSPDQLKNIQPAAETAVTRTVEPLACGLEVLVEIVQPAVMAPAGATVVVRV